MKSLFSFLVIMLLSINTYANVSLKRIFPKEVESIQYSITLVYPGFNYYHPEPPIYRADVRLATDSGTYVFQFNGSYFDVQFRAENLMYDLYSFSVDKTDKVPEKSIGVTWIDQSIHSGYGHWHKTEHIQSQNYITAATSFQPILVLQAYNGNIVGSWRFSSEEN